MKTMSSSAQNETVGVATSLRPRTSFAAIGVVVG